MRLVRFATNDTPSKPGLMIDDAVIALNDLLPDAPIDMIGVIARWEDIKGPLAKRVAECPVSPIRNATLLAPIETSWQDSRHRIKLCGSYRGSQGRWGEDPYRAGLVLQATDFRERAFWR